MIWMLTSLKQIKNCLLMLKRIPLEADTDALADSDTDKEPLKDSEDDFSEAETEVLVDADAIDSDTDKEPLNDSDADFSGS